MQMFCLGSKNSLKNLFSLINQIKHFWYLLLAPYLLFLIYFLGFQENQIMSQTTDNLDENDFSKNDIISEETEEEELDPRVQEELEKLNQHTDQINKLELQLEDANCLFRTLLTDSTHQLKALASKIGTLYLFFFLA